MAENEDDNKQLGGSAAKKVGQVAGLLAFPLLGLLLMLLIVGPLALLVSNWPEHRLGYAACIVGWTALGVWLLDVGLSRNASSISNPRGIFAICGLVLGAAGIAAASIHDVWSGLVILAQCGFILMLAEMTELQLNRSDQKRDAGILISARRQQWVIAAFMGLATLDSDVVFGLKLSDWTPEMFGYVLSAFALLPPFGRHQGGEQQDD